MTMAEERIPENSRRHFWSLATEFNLSMQSGEDMRRNKALVGSTLVRVYRILVGETEMLVD